MANRKGVKRKCKGKGRKRRRGGFIFTIPAIIAAATAAASAVGTGVLSGLAGYGVTEAVKKIKWDAEHAAPGLFRQIPEYLAQPDGVQKLAKLWGTKVTRYK